MRYSIALILSLAILMASLGDIEATRSYRRSPTRGSHGSRRLIVTTKKPGLSKTDLAEAAVNTINGIKSVRDFVADNFSGDDDDESNTGTTYTPSVFTVILTAASTNIWFLWRKNIYC